MEPPLKIKPIIEKIMTILRPHLLPLSRAPEMINEDMASITNIATIKPPLVEAIIPNKKDPTMFAIIPIAITPMIDIIPGINTKTARIVIPVGLGIFEGLDCSVEIGFPHFGQKLFSATSSAPQY